MLKAIETKYKGYKFRSRLEARWAVFFDALGITWEYEKEGYDLGKAGWYLPDFWLPQVNMWAEVKPDRLTKEETEKCSALVRGTKHPCLLLVGMPENTPYWAIELAREEDGSDELCQWDYCLTMYHGYPISEGRFYCCPGDEGQFDDTGEAVLAARSARFEHGK